MNLAQYFPVLLFIIVATLIGAALLGAGRLLGRNVPDAEKLSPYECGFEAFGDARMKFDVRYYLIAIQFIVFDLEIVFLVPWARCSMEWWASLASGWCPVRGRAVPRLYLRVEEGSAGMGVIQLSTG